MSAQTNPHVNAVFGKLFDQMFPVIPKPEPLPELTPEQLEEGDATEERR